MLIRTPPLNALRAFEAAARHGSFTGAADELFVTPGAVSHQVAALEEMLKLRLFVRGPRGLAPTSSAQACLPVLSRAFTLLHDAVVLLQGESGIRPLVVDAAPGFTTRWLLPRLAGFTARHPDVGLRVGTGLDLVDFKDAERSAPASDAAAGGRKADVSIRFGNGVYPGRTVHKLFDAELTPVCSPELLAGRSSLLEDEWRDVTLLHDETAYFGHGEENWSAWLVAAGVTAVPADPGLRFGHAGLALDAAQDGLGMALGITALIEPAIRTKRLIAPFSFALPSANAYYLVYDAGAESRSEVTRFRDWLMAETGTP